MADDPLVFRGSVGQPTTTPKLDWRRAVYEKVFVCEWYWRRVQMRRNRVTLYFLSHSHIISKMPDRVISDDVRIITDLIREIGFVRKPIARAFV